MRWQKWALRDTHALPRKLACERFSKYVNKRDARPLIFYEHFEVILRAFQNFKEQTGRKQKLDRIGSNQIDKTPTGSDWINKTWIGLGPVDKAQTGSKNSGVKSHN